MPLRRPLGSYAPTKRAFTKQDHEILAMVSKNPTYMKVYSDILSSESMRYKGVLRKKRVAIKSRFIRPRGRVSIPPAVRQRALRRAYRHILNMRKKGLIEAYEMRRRYGHPKTLGLVHLPGMERYTDIPLTRKGTFIQNRNAYAAGGGRSWLGG